MNRIEAVSKVRDLLVQLWVLTMLEVLSAGLALQVILRQYDIEFGLALGIAGGVKLLVGDTSPDYMPGWAWCLYSVALHWLIVTGILIVGVLV